MDFHLNILIEGLKAIASTPEEKYEINYNHASPIVDEVFDFEPLDYLVGLKARNLITEEIALEVKALYESSDIYLGSLSIEQEDKLISENVDFFKKSRKKATNLLKLIKIHNKLIKVDPPNQGFF